MLPSKGYFKTLNCPHFEIGNCERLHCHFRHIKIGDGFPERVNGDFTQLEEFSIKNDLSHTIEDIDNLSDRKINDTTTLNNGILSLTQQYRCTSYKPTPISELKKRFDHTNNNDKNSNNPSVGPSYINRLPMLEYKASKILDSGKVVIDSNNLPLNTNFKKPDIEDDNFLQQDNDESEEEIDFNELNKAINYFGDILNQYDNNIVKQPTPSETLDNSNNNCKDNLNVTELSNNGLKEEIDSKIQLEHLPNTVENYSVNKTETNIQSAHEESKQKYKSETNIQSTLEESKQKYKSETNIQSTLEESKQKYKSETNIQSTLEESKQKYKSETNIQSTLEESKQKYKSNAEEKNTSSSSHNKEHKTKVKTSSSSKPTTHKNDDNKEKKNYQSTEKDKHRKRHHSSQSNTEHKTTEKDKKKEHSSKLHQVEKDSQSKKEGERSKSSKRESDRRHSSSKSSKKDTDQKHSTSKSSKGEPEHTNSTQQPKEKIVTNKDEINKSHHKPHSSSNKSKEDSRAKRHSTESSHSRENKDKKSKDKKSSSDEKRPQKRPMKPLLDSNVDERTHNFSKKRRLSIGDETLGDDVVEIVTDSDPVIVIDSEDESVKSDNDQKIECISISPSPSPQPSPIMPSDISLSDSDEEPKPKKPNIDLDDSTLLDHRVISRVKNRISLGFAYRPQQKKKIEILTPAARIAMYQNKCKEQDNCDNQLQPPACVKIGSVPNVQSLLEEKKRLLTISSNVAKRARPITTVRSSVSTASLEDKDEPPKVIQEPHPEKKGADLQTRQENIEVLYQAVRQLVKPSDTYKTAKNKCLDIERDVWLATRHDTYCKQMKQRVIKVWSKVPKFTLRYYRAIKPQTDSLYVKQTGEGNVSEAKKVSLYSVMQRFLLTDDQLESEGYPRKKSDPLRDDLAYINEESQTKYKKVFAKPPTGELVCHKCQRFYRVDERGLSTDNRGCNYHAKSSIYQEGIRGNKTKRYRCCGETQENPCMTSLYHATEKKTIDNLEGFVETKEPIKREPPEGWGIFGVDCEMYWSTEGLELGRVTVVNVENRIVYDTCVKPLYPVTDYCTRMSGLTETSLNEAEVYLTDVQRAMLELFNSKTILIGHSLENDLKALKLTHNTVVDTALVFRTNPDRKPGLKMLAKDQLNEVIQNEEDGHNSAEDAITCIKLMLHKISKENSQKNKPKAPILKMRYSNQHSNC